MTHRDGVFRIDLDRARAGASIVAHLSVDAGLPTLSDALLGRIDRSRLDGRRIVICGVCAEEDAARIAETVAAIACPGFGGGSPNRIAPEPGTFEPFDLRCDESCGTVITVTSHLARFALCHGCGAQWAPDSEHRWRRLGPGQMIPTDQTGTVVVDRTDDIASSDVEPRGEDG